MNFDTICTIRSCIVMDIIKMNPRNLIMCVTPLQMIIAEKIIELHPDKEFDLLVLALNDNEKYRHYYERLKFFCINSLYIISKPGLLGFADYIKQLKVKSLNIKYQDMYLASIDSRHFQYIVSKNQGGNLYTFDDGTANIIPSDIYYLNSKPNILKRVIWRLFGIKYYMKDLKDVSLLHYTIYKDIPNILENKYYLPLFSNETNAQKKYGLQRTVSFYLGQPLIEISKKFDIHYVENIINNLKIDYYYPHPRENTYPEGSFQLINSHLIFEDYIIEFLKNHPNTTVNIFSFISTALLNIMSLDRIKVSYIHNSEIFELHYSFYKLAEENFGIPLLDLDE